MEKRIASGISLYNFDPKLPRKAVTEVSIRSDADHHTSGARLGPPARRSTCPATHCVVIDFRTERAEQHVHP